MSEIVVISTSASKYFADRIVDQIPGAVYREIDRGQFDGSEHHYCICLKEKRELWGKVVVFVASITNDDELNDVCRVGPTAAGLGARRVIYVIPFEAYTTMDKAKKDGEVVTAKDVAVRFSRLKNGDIRNAFLFLDLHTTAFRQFFEGDTFHEEMDARDVITGAIAELGLPDFDCASTDLGRPARIEEIADMFGGGVALISKMRNKLGKSRVRRVIAEHSLAGRTLLISDDMIRSADSLLNAVEAYQKNEAVGFFAEATHLALDSEEIIDRLLASPIQTIVTTNSHPMSQHPRVQGSSRFVVKDVSHCFIEAIIRFAA